MERIAILHRVRTPKPSPTPKWKEIILAGPGWPEDLTIPQDDALPEDSKRILESTYFNVNRAASRKQFPISV